MKKNYDLGEQFLNAVGHYDKYDFSACKKKTLDII